MTMENVLSCELATSMRRLGMSNEEVIDEILEFAEMMEHLTLVAQINTKQLREMETVSSIFQGGSKQINKRRQNSV